MSQIIDSILEPALWFGADWSLRWAALISVVGLLLWIVRPRRAAIRQLFLMIALIAGLLVPLVPRWGNGWKHRPYPEVSESPAMFAPPLSSSVSSPPPASSSVANSPSFPNGVWERTSGNSVSRPTREPDAKQSFANVRSQTEFGNEGDEEDSSREPLGLRGLSVLALVSLWILAVSYQLIRRVSGWIYLRRVGRESVEATGTTADLFAACRVELRVRSTARLAVHPHVHSPILIGWLRLRILVPPDWPQRSVESQRAGLLHELAHVRRHDHLFAPLLGLIRIAFFFHPLVRWLLARLEYEREVLCDEMVVRLGIDRRDYARLLVELARSSGRLAWLSASLPMSRRRTVKGRIYHLLEEDMERWIRPLPLRWAVVSGFGALVLMLGLASYRVWAVDNAHPETDAEREKPAKVEKRKRGEADNLAATRFKREELRYGGKDFNEWRQNLLTELKGSIRVDGMKAFAAFGANGYGVEATEAILDMMRGYDTTVNSGTDRDDDGCVVWSAYAAINKIGASAIPALTKAVKDKNRNVRRFAVQALGEQGADARSAVPEILQAMKSDDSELQRRAIMAVSSIDSHADGVVAALIETLKGKHVENRYQAVPVLRSIGEAARPAVPALIAVLRDKNPNVRVETIRALRELGAGKEAIVPISRLLRDEDSNARQEAYKLLDALGADAKDAVPALIAVLKAPKDRFTSSALEILASIGPGAKDAVPTLNELLRNDDGDIRRGAVYALKKIIPEEKR